MDADDRSSVFCHLQKIIDLCRIRHKPFIILNGKEFYGFTCFKRWILSYENHQYNPADGNSITVCWRSANSNRGVTVQWGSEPLHEERIPVRGMFFITDYACNFCKGVII